MDKNYYNFLKFRTDLIELLAKYKFEISGTGFDDGSMRIVVPICAYCERKNIIIF